MYNLKEKFQIKNDRARKVIFNSLISVSVRGLSIVIGFLTFPIYVKYFTNQSALGVWLTLLSVLSWIFTFDLGIGNGLRNHLVVALAQGEDEEVKKYISSSYASVIIICIVFSIFFIVFSNLVDFNTIFNVSQNVCPPQVLKQVLNLLFVGTMIQFSLKLITSIFMALQKAAIPSLLAVISNFLLFMYLLFSKPGSIQQNFFNIALFYVVSVNVPLLIATLCVFNKELKKCRPNINSIKVGYAKKTIKIGVVFLLLQLMSMIVFSTNNYLITIFVGPKAVVEYQVYYKLFSLISTFFMIAINPLWSAVTDALAKNDFNWIRKVYITLIKLLPLLLLGEILVYCLSSFVVGIWMGKAFISTNAYLLILIGVSDFMLMVHSIHAYIANGMGKLNNQIIFLSCGAIINIPLAFFISRYDRNSSAIVLANIISLLPYIIMESRNFRRKLV